MRSVAAPGPASSGRAFRESADAWAYFCDLPPGYRRLAIWFVVSAKRDKTQLRRLRQVIDASAAGTRLGVLFGQTGMVPAKSPKSRPKPQAPPSPRRR